ncbi:MAG: peptidoglycan bridge formation glycyltransferase FemA/FemB family protein [Limnochordia bacterium]|nr:peptidoglycan bridge formation glycyltransferase FemA/FemB family protein [Limnochordia bacterium]
MRAKLLHTQERELFNAFVRSQNGSFLQSFEWGELKQFTGWQPLRLVLEDGGQIHAGISILILPLPMGRSILYAPHGPIIPNCNQRLLHLLLQEIEPIARENRAIFLKIDPPIPSTQTQYRKALLEAGLRLVDKGKNFENVQPKYVFRLGIEKSEEELLNDMKSKTRYNIRYALRKGVKVRCSMDKRELEGFYTLLLETCKRDGFSVRSFAYFSRMWDIFVPRNMARLFLAHYEGQLLSATLLFLFGKQAWYVYGASSNEHRNLQPNYAIQWEMIRYAKQKGCTVYDFRGISGDLDPENPLYGLYRFKEGFNPTLVEYIGEFDLPYNVLLWQLYNKGEPLLRQMMLTKEPLKQRIKGLLFPRSSS